MDPVSNDSGPSANETGKFDRRRLLKAGAAAGPLVLTLRGNGGWVGSGTLCNIDRKTGQPIKTTKLSPACLASLGISKKKKTGGRDFLYDEDEWG